MRLPRLNLTRFHMIDFGVSARFPASSVTEAVAESLLSQQENSSARDGTRQAFFAVSSYNGRDVKKTPHSLVCYAALDEDDQASLNMAIHYNIEAKEVNTALRRAIHGRREGEIADALERLGPTENIDISATIRRASGSASDLWFPLPSTVNDRLGPIEIRGIRGARFRPNRELSEYRFTMDRPTGEGVYFSIDWNGSGEITAEFLKRALIQGDRYATELIRRNAIKDDNDVA